MLRKMAKQGIIVDNTKDEIEKLNFYLIKPNIRKAHLY